MSNLETSIMIVLCKIFLPIALIRLYKTQCIEDNSKTMYWRYIQNNRRSI